MKRTAVFCLTFILALSATLGTSALSAPLTEQTSQAERSESASGNEAETEVQTKAETEVQTESDNETSVSLGSSADEIIGIIESSESRSDAILALIGLLGCSSDEAEQIIESFIALGDRYAADSALWVGFRRDLRENTEFWAMLLTCISAALAIVGGIFVLLCRTNPAMKRAAFGMSEALSISRTQLGESKEVLARIESLAQGSTCELGVIGERLAALEARSAERDASLLVQLSALRALKLICDRSAMPVCDKAVIDLWYRSVLSAARASLGDGGARFDGLCALLESGSLEADGESS